MMPQLPVMKKSESSSAESESRSDSVISSFADDSEVNASESEVIQEDEAFKKPVLNSPAMNNQTQVKVALSSKRGIEVVAQRKGFYNQQRYKEGDKFFIKFEKEFGEWMKCVDPTLEKKRIEFLKAKKANK